MSEYILHDIRTLWQHCGEKRQTANWLWM